MILEKVNYFVCDFSCFVWVERYSVYIGFVDLRSNWENILK